MSVDHDRQSLDAKESAIYEQIIKTPRYLTNEYYKRMLPRIEKGLKNVIEMAKAQFSGKFGGWFPTGNQIGIADLRPHHLGGSKTWRTNYTSTGFQNYLGNATTTIDEDIYLYMWAWENVEPVPRSSEIKIVAGVQRIPPQDLRSIRVLPDRILPMPEPIILVPKTTWEADVRIDQAGNDSLRPLGFVVGPSHRITKDAYY